MTRLEIAGDSCSPPFIGHGRTAWALSTSESTDESRVLLSNTRRIDDGTWNYSSSIHTVGLVTA